MNYYEIVNLRSCWCSIKYKLHITIYKLNYYKLNYILLNCYKLNYEYIKK